MIITHCSVHLLTSWRIFTGEIDCIYDIWYSSVAAGLLTGCRHDNAVHIGAFLTKLCPVEIAFNFSSSEIERELCVSSAQGDIKNQIRRMPWNKHS